MSDLLSIGASGVRAYQTALTAVGENIANVGTDGYSRRTVTMREVVPAAGLAANKVSAGSGVAVAGIARATDVYASAAVRAATADLSRTTTGATWLTRIESAMTASTLAPAVTSGRTSWSCPRVSARNNIRVRASKTRSATTLAKPTENPTVNPTENPTVNPTENPTVNSTENPTINPTETAHPTENPTESPTMEISAIFGTVKIVAGTASFDACGTTSRHARKGVSYILLSC